MEPVEDKRPVLVLLALAACSGIMVGLIIYALVDLTRKVF